MVRRFIFIRDFVTEFGKIDKGAELDIVNGVLYLNGGMIEGWYYDIFHDLITKSELRDKYLKETQMPPQNVHNYDYKDRY